MSAFAAASARKTGWMSLGVVVMCVLLSLCCEAQIAVRGKLTHEFVVEPGQSYAGEIVISSTTDSATGVEITQSDYLFFADGSNVYGEPGSVLRSNVKWISFYAPPTIGPGETVSIPFNIKVPDDPSLIGTYWSMILVAPELPPAEPPEEGLGIQQRMRYGIQIVTHIGDTGERKIKILDVKLIREEEGPVLQLDVENTGERWVRPMAWAELYDEQGTTVGRVESSQLRIYPGCSVRHRFVLSEIPSGVYKGLVVFDNNDEYVWGAQYDLEL